MFLDRSNNTKKTLLEYDLFLSFSNLGSSFHYKRNFEQAMANHNNVLKIAQELKDKSIEARAYAGLGHAARCTGDIVQAKMWHEKQLDMALMTKVSW